MVPLRRDAAPTVLAENAARWAEEYHALRRMSHNKCFYCETRLARARRRSTTTSK